MKIETIEGIGPAFAKKLRKEGIRSTGELLKRGATKKGRVEIAGSTDIPEKLILEWVNLADLMRIKGVGEEYSDLLEEAGVDTVKELRNRKPENLVAKMVEVNQKKKLVRRDPSLKEVMSWVEQAKALPPMVRY
jgi:predicted flap endonuclease-1-like 5' DNA nuclease